MSTKKLSLRLLLSFEVKAVLLGLIVTVLATFSSIALMASAAWFLTAMGIAGSAMLLINIFIPSALIRMFAVSRTALRYAERLTTHNATFKIIERLRVFIFKNLLKLPLPLTLELKKSDLERRFRENTQQLEYAFLRDALPKLIAFIFCALALILLSFINPILAIVIFILIAVCSCLMPYVLMKVLQKDIHTMALVLKSLNDATVDVGTGLFDLKLLGADKRLKDKMLCNNLKLSKIRYKLKLCEELLLSFAQVTAMLALVVTLYLMYPYVLRNEIGGAFYALIAIGVYALFEVIYPLALSFTRFIEVKQAINELNSFLDKAQDIKKETSKLDTILEKIEFRNLNFAYTKDSLVLNDFSKSFVNTHNYALCGKVGSGKSTLLYLMTGLLDNYEGTILFNDQDLKTLDKSSVREHISVAVQGNEFFSGSIKNIMQAVKADVTTREIEDVLKIVELDDFMHSLPEGLDQFLGNNGTAVSGGQARRLNIARALLLKREFLILDEPSEGLDVKQEQRILERILQLRKGVILITHKKAGIDLCDEKIYLSV